MPFWRLNFLENDGKDDGLSLIPTLLLVVRLISSPFALLALGSVQRSTRSFPARAREEEVCVDGRRDFLSAGVGIRKRRERWTNFEEVDEKRNPDGRRHSSSLARPHALPDVKEPLRKGKSNSSL